MLAVPWYFATQNMSSDFNLFYGIITFSVIFWGLFAGTLVDKFPRKGLFLSTNAVEGTIVLVIAGAGWYHGYLPFYLVAAVFGITMFGYHLHYPNLYAFAQEITPPRQYTRITSYIEIVGQSTNVLAGALAAILLEGLDFDHTFSGFGYEIPISLHIEKWHLYEIFTLDGITYFISVFIISFIRYTPVKEIDVELGNFWSRLKTGFLYLKDHSVLFMFGIFSYSVFVTMLVKLHALMPLYITNHLQEGGYVFGLMELLYAAGALSAGIFARNIFKRLSIPKAIILLIFLGSLVFFLSAFTKSVPIFFTVGLLLGFSNAGTRVLRLSYIFSHVPNSKIGRVNSVFSVLNVIMRVVFILLFSHSFFSQGSNITFAYGILGTFLLVSGIFLLINFRKLEKL